MPAFRWGLHRRHPGMFSCAHTPATLYSWVHTHPCRPVPFPCFSIAPPPGMLLPLLPASCLTSSTVPGLSRFIRYCITNSQDGARKERQCPVLLLSTSQLLPCRAEKFILSHSYFSRKVKTVGFSSHELPPILNVGNSTLCQKLGWLRPKLPGSLVTGSALVWGHCPSRPLLEPLPSQ